MSEFDAILFDKDGTLFDFRKTWGAWSRSFILDIAGGDPDLARRLGRAVEFDLETCRYGSGSVLVSATPHKIAEVLLPFLPGATFPGLVNRMNALSAEVELQEATPLVPLLTELAVRSLRIGVITNDSEFPARSHLAAAGVSDFVDRIIGCDCGFAPKPAPDMLLAFAETARLDPGRIVFVGDSCHDMNAARAAGMVPVGVLTGVATRDQLAVLAEIVLPSIGDLPRWLDSRDQAESAA